MIKFLATRDDGGHILGLMLSAENVKRLTQGKPIHIFLEEMQSLPWKGEILLGYGATEDEIAAGLKDVIGPSTVIHKQGRRDE